MMISNCSRQFQMNERNLKVTKCENHRTEERTNHETRQNQNVLLVAPRFGRSHPLFSGRRPRTHSALE